MDLHKVVFLKIIFRTYGQFVPVKFALCCGLLASGAVSAQAPIQAQPLAFKALLEAASASYPTLVAARLEARAAGEDVAAAERIRWPTLSTTV
jgi:hypothetical protein